MSVSCSGAGKRVNRKALQQSARLAVEGLEIRMLLSAGGGFTAAGITGDYYNSTDLSGPVAFERQDVRVDFDWGAAAAPGGSTAPNFASIGHNNFSARWSGQLVPAFSQTYTFKTISDDGVRLYLRPAGTTSWTTVIDDWTSHTAKTDTAAYALTAGVTYDVRMEYYQTTGAALAELHWSSPTKPEEPIEAASDVGVNMTAYAQTTYADAMKVGRTYWEGGTPQDANGWPTTDATNIPWEGADPASVAGTYLLSFTGTAQVTAQPFGPANFVVNGTSYGSVLPKGVGYNSTTNTTTASLTLTSSNAGLFRLSFDNSQRTAAGATNTGVTNVQLMRPTSPGASTSYPLGTVFTDYAKTAMSRITTERWLTADFNLNDVNWSDRTLPSYFKADFGASGQIWEYLVMFSNETGKDLYITVPTTASDSYLTNLADLIKYGSDGVNAYTAPQANPVYPGLNSNLRVYVEWGNETWNVDFPQGVQGREAAAGAVASNSPEGQIENYDGQAGGGDYRRWNALKTLDTSNDFRSVWGDSAMGDRVRIL
ncbi:MAG TPA: PA14 domain-containing protein, partial [Tepidisphaeraceae bacterium]|nr:PA14 domain-containing protein [Tepidisphaeraceae bacterium]